MTPNIGENVQVVKRVLTVFFLLDRSGSMENEGRIARLNDAIPVTVDALRAVQEGNPNLRIRIKVVSFSDAAQFYIAGADGEDLEKFVWRPLSAGGRTATAQAVNLLCDELQLEKMPRRGYPPVCVLVSDGYCTESEEAYDAAIKRLNMEPWGKKAARIVISIGSDIDEESLKRFVNERGSYINCTEAGQIIDFIRLKTTEATISSTEQLNPLNAAGANVVSENSELAKNSAPSVRVDTGDVF